MEKKIYLDNNASTPLDPRVLQAVLKSYQDHTGNPSSIHCFGQNTNKAITDARIKIAEYLGVKPRELIFTSGGSEAINMVIRGLFFGKPLGHIITSDVEHSSVFNTVKNLEKLGHETTFLSAGLIGAVTCESVKNALKSHTKLIVLAAVNNETGVKTNISEIAELASAYDIPFVVDAVALLGKESFTIPEGVSAMCFSGHKMHAPKGIGLAYVKQSLKISPLILGGNQELGRRAGTENVPGIIGFAEAISILEEELEKASIKMRNLRDALEKGIMSQLPEVIVNGQGPRIVNVSNLAFPGIDGESLLMNLDKEGVAVSHGSACVAGALEPSRVLLNMGLPLALARSSIRFTVSRLTTLEEIHEAVAIVIKIIQRLRK